MNDGKLHFVLQMKEELGIQKSLHPHPYVLCIIARYLIVAKWLYNEAVHPNS